MNLQQNSTVLKNMLINLGASVIGIADTKRLADLETSPPDLLHDFPRAVSIAVHLSDAIINMIRDQPTPLYSAHYSRVNGFLDNLALQTTSFVQKMGCKALPIPASMILDRQRWTSVLSHKAVAIAAGVGWQGKSLLVINPDYGPRIRLVTVLTDADLSPDLPLKNRCGRCSRCKDACPAGAIIGNNTKSHYPSVSDALDLSRCLHQVQDIFGNLPNISPGICGVCIRVCPWGAKTRKRGAQKETSCEKKQLSDALQKRELDRQREDQWMG